MKSEKSQRIIQRGAEVETWFDKPMRWSQLTLVENDPLEMDCDFWLDYFKRIKSDAICLSAGGYMAFYPTQIPFHYKSKFLGESDPFGYLVEGCRKLGMTVIARTDPHAIHDDAYTAHPDWAAVDKQGEPRRHWAMPSLWVTCALGPYNFDFMTAVNNEIMEMYQVDGIFSNRWAGSGMCYCQHCRENFRAEYGLELPTLGSQDPAYKEFLLWRSEQLFRLYDLWDGDIRRINPAARFIPNSGGGALHDLDMTEIGRRSETLFADRQARRGLAVPWANGKNGKELRATLGRKPIGGIFSVGVEEPYRWKDSVQNDEEIRIWVAEAIANGLRPWWTKFAGSVYDSRWLGVVEDVYNWAADVEPYLRNEAPLARVAMVYSQQTAAYYGKEEAKRKVEEPALGIYHALVEARIPFEMVHDRLLSEENLQNFKTLILPNIAALSDSQCEQIRQFVRRGGSLLATYETSLYDEWGKQRSNFGLADLFGVDYVQHTPGPMKNSYLNLQRASTQEAVHPLIEGINNTERVINGTYRLEVKENVDFPAMPLTLVPSYPDLPMEEVYPREPQTDIPEVYLREMGDGRVVFFPWNIDQIFWEILSVDHGRILTNAVKWATNEPEVVTVSGPGVLDVTVWRQAESMTVHMVNLTNPMMMKGPFRQFFPVGRQKVQVQLPKDVQVKSVTLLKAGLKPEYKIVDDYLTLIVPQIVEHEVVGIDFM